MSSLLQQAQTSGSSAVGGGDAGANTTPGTGPYAAITNSFLTGALKRVTAGGAQVGAQAVRGATNSTQSIPAAGNANTGAVAGVANTLNTGSAGALNGNSGSNPNLAQRQRELQAQQEQQQSQQQQRQTGARFSPDLWKLLKGGGSKEDSNGNGGAGSGQTVTGQPTTAVSATGTTIPQLVSAPAGWKLPVRGNQHQHATPSNRQASPSSVSVSGNNQDYSVTQHHGVTNQHNHSAPKLNTDARGGMVTTTRFSLSNIGGNQVNNSSNYTTSNNTTHNITGTPSNGNRLLGLQSPRLAVQPLTGSRSPGFSPFPGTQMPQQIAAAPKAPVAVPQQMPQQMPQQISALQQSIPTTAVAVRATAVATYSSSSSGSGSGSSTSQQSRQSQPTQPTKHYKPLQNSSPSGKSAQVGAIANAAAAQTAQHGNTVTNSTNTNSTNTNSTNTNSTNKQHSHSISSGISNVSLLGNNHPAGNHPLFSVKGAISPRSGGGQYVPHSAAPVPKYGYAPQASYVGRPEQPLSTHNSISTAQHPTTHPATTAPVQGSNVVYAPRTTNTIV
jgi:hypothetical protein